MSDEADFTVSAQCPTCHVPVQYEESEGDAAVVRCPQCGEEYGTYGELRQKMVEKAQEHLKDSLRDSLKAHPWIKVE